MPFSTKEKRQEYYQKTKHLKKEYYVVANRKEIQRDRARNNKIKAIDFFGNKCLDCGLESEFSTVYDFHHLDPSVKENGISKLMSYSWNKIETELKKCVMLCANCHRIRHAKERE